MEKQLTALEWLEEELDSINRTQIEWHETFEKAKEIFEQQIIDAFNIGYNNGNIDTNKNAKQYYNEQFKK